MTYMYGYSQPPARRTLVELDRIAQWNRMDPEFRRRLIAMFDASNLTVGFGGGWRSSAQQRALFLSRYHLAPTGILFEGKHWQKNAGVASAAPPGRSYHEETTPDGQALAADLIGDLKFVHAHGPEFGVHDFGNVNNEPWHVQPNEIPNGRTGYRQSMHPLPAWPLATPPPPTLPGVIRVGERGIDFSYARPPAAAIKANGFTFVVRYLTVPPGKAEKKLTNTEAQLYLNAGLKILLVWEVTATTPNQGAAQGWADGANAAGQAAELGYPHDVPILVAVDTNSTAANIGMHEAYVRGFRERCAPWSIGVYGDVDIIGRVSDICRIGWVSNAWSWSGGSRVDMIAKARALGAHVLQGSQYNLDGKWAVDPNEVIRDIPAWDAQHVPPGPEKPPTLPKPQLPPLPEDDDMPTNLHVTADGRGEIHVTLDGSGATLLGYSSPADRDNINAATGARACPVTPEQFDVIVALARTGDGN